MQWKILFVSQELQMWGHCKTYNKIRPHFIIFHIHFAFKKLAEVHGKLMAWVAMVQFIHYEVGTHV